jgi:hypothetical protein
MYRIWEQVIGYFPNKPSFDQWVDSLDPLWAQRRIDFENSANNPAYGSDRRHAKRTYVIRPDPRTGLTPRPMNRDDAVDLIKRVVVKWIAHEYGVVLDPQFDHVK